MQRNPISSDNSHQIVIDYQKEAKMHFCAQGYVENTDINDFPSFGLVSWAKEGV